ncbi:angiogenic factor with G patch and FHA domains 1-like isoform X2 [Oncorhynchus keta]|uniref:angiogenic factor with G patch and FHA domains 1-like isoform X2 n=1 Tax=Oncorhynchus keta TaxID=8018 RepID=UPI0015FC2A41|nr:angiogenic factor with G patch and FHA domains 1-like isoform X2 [Oncorhynchus keta]
MCQQCRVVTRCLCSTFRLIFSAERKEGERPSEAYKRIAGSMATNGEEASGGEDGSESEVAELRQKVESLQKQLRNCRKELTTLQKQLTTLQKQLSKSERLQKNTEGYNEDLRKQVDRLSTEIHERKTKTNRKAEAETQTAEYTWSETDYYNYYYGGGYYRGDGVATDTEGIVIAEGQEATDASQMTAAESTNDPATYMITDTMTATETVTEVSVGGGVTAAQPEQEVDAGSIADMLRATAEQAMTQTGFVFDETTGMYYDHSTGFYYDSASQLYYDNNTGMYYYYDAESGKYQFHSRIEVPTVQPVSETSQEKRSLDKKGRKWKKVPERASRQEDKGLVKELEFEEWIERRIPKREVASRRQRGRSVTPDTPPQKKSSSKTRRAKSAEHSLKRKKRNDWSRSDASSSRRKKAKSDRRGSKEKAAVSGRDGLRGNSEPEEGEITESEGEWKSTSSSSSPPRPTKYSSESEMESQEVAEEVWPPCVRVTVVRSPVLQTGTLFIITADSPATIGREKDMNHAIRLSEMGVSKFHAEVYFDQDQQCYMLVDQGSQNGTVLNGNRILQPKAKCDPCPLTHGDEVKMGETVLSFHIHSGTDTCDGCEPGQVMAHLGKHQRNQPEQTGPAPTKEDKELLRQKELKQMKVKYGLKSTEYEETKALRNPRYVDRAESRRQTVGSEGAFQRDDAPASVHIEISEVNKGRKMLEKMGWKKGEGLGKDGAGMKDPIQLKIRKSQSGLGAGAAVSVDEAGSLSKNKTQRNWEKARERFNDTCQPDTPTVKKEQGLVTKPWVKGEVTE